MTARMLPRARLVANGPHPQLLELTRNVHSLSGSLSGALAHWSRHAHDVRNDFTWLLGATRQGPQQSELSRDFTYVDDIVEGVIASLTHIPPSKPGSAQYKVRTSSSFPR